MPGDKSVSHRAIIFNSLASGSSTVTNLSPGRDCLSTIRCLRALGVRIKEQEFEPLTFSIQGVGNTGFAEPENILNAGNSATTMRLLGGLLASQAFLSIMTGDTSLRSRPMRRLIEPLKLMGAEIYGRGNDAFAPLVIRGGGLCGIKYSLPVPSAQIKSAILLAGLFAQGDTIIKQPVPSRDHTERLLRLMRADISNSGNDVSVKPLVTTLTPVDVHIPGDISSAAYWLVAGAIHPDARIRIIKCGMNPTRTGIIDVLLAMGARLKIENHRFEGNEPVADICVESSRLKSIEISKEIIPRLIDEIPVLVVAACAAKGNTIIRDASELRIKESDRIMTVAHELSRLGAKIEEMPDGMVVYGGQSLTGSVVNSHADHRLAMSLAVAGLVAEGETIIRNAGVVEISYPDFWMELERLTSN